MLRKSCSLKNYRMNEQANERPNKQIGKKLCPLVSQEPWLLQTPLSLGQPWVPGQGKDQTFLRLVSTVRFWATALAHTKGRPGCLLSGPVQVLFSTPMSLSPALPGSQESGLDGQPPQVGLTPLLSTGASPPWVQVSAQETGIRWASRGPMCTSFRQSAKTAQV